MNKFEQSPIENPAPEQEKSRAERNRLYFAIKDNKELSHVFEEFVRTRYNVRSEDGEFPYSQYIRILLSELPNREDFESFVRDLLERQRELPDHFKKVVGVTDKQWEQDFGSSYADSLRKLADVMYGGAKENLDNKASGLESKISQAASFEDLYRIITEAGGIQAQDGHLYTAEDLNYILKTVKDRLRDESYVTRAGGLRNKVTELLGK